MFCLPISLAMERIQMHLHSNSLPTCVVYVREYRQSAKSFAGVCRTPLGSNGIVQDPAFCPQGNELDVMGAGRPLDSFRATPLRVAHL